MNVLFLLSIDLNTNGPSVHLLSDIISEAKIRKHLVTVVQKNSEDNRIRVSKVDLLETRISIPAKTKKKTNYIGRYMADLRYVINYVKQLRKQKERFDAVFVQSNNIAGFHAFAIRRVLKAPFLYNVQDIFPLDASYEGIIKQKSIPYIILDRLQRYAYKKASSLVTISGDIKETLVRIGKIRPEKIKVVYNWSYESEFSEKDNSYIRSLLFNEEKYYVVYAGNIGMAQSVETMVRTANDMKDNIDIRFLIIGEGSKKEACKKMADDFGLTNVFFYDLLPQKYSRYIYRNADINVITLIKGIYRVSLPSKTAACYDSGRPVIYCIEPESYSVQKMMELNKRVFRCDPENHTELSETIMHIKQQNNNSEKALPYSQSLLPQSPIEYVDELEKIARVKRR